MGIGRETVLQWIANEYACLIRWVDCGSLKFPRLTSGFVQRSKRGKINKESNRKNNLSGGGAGALLKKSLLEVGFDGIFTEVEHAESLGLKNPHQLRMFHLNVGTSAFSLDALHRFLRRNIGRYVYSRAKIEQFHVEGDSETIAFQAISLLRKVCNMDDSWIGEGWRCDAVYILEQILGAPKLYNKIELAQW